jgi:DNA polymerase III epsilon subunit-like protein
VAFDDYVSHRYVDTMAAGTFLILADKLPGRQPMGLAALLKEHGIVNGAAHTALGDAVATSRLLEAMIGRMKAGE